MAKPKTTPRPFDVDEQDVVDEYAGDLLRTALGMILASREWSSGKLFRAAGLGRRKKAEISWPVFAVCCAAAGEEPSDVLGRAHRHILECGKAGEMAELLLARTLELDPDKKDEILAALRAEP